MRNTKSKKSKIMLSSIICATLIICTSTPIYAEKEDTSITCTEEILTKMDSDVVSETEYEVESDEVVFINEDDADLSKSRIINGVEYTINMEETDEGVLFSVYQSDTSEVKTFLLDNNYSKLVQYSYDLNVNDNGDIEIQDEEVIDCEQTIYDIEELEDNSNELFISSAISYNSKKYAAGDYSKYYYCYGYDAKDNKYMKIGCDASYRINYYNLNTQKKDKCKSYAKHVDSCRTNYETMVRNNNYNGISTAAFIALVVANIACPVSWICDIIVVALGISGDIVWDTCITSINCCKTYIDDGDKLKSEYKVIREYGQKL